MNNEEAYKQFRQKALNIIQMLQQEPESRYFINSQYLSSDSKYIRYTPHPMNLSSIWEKLHRNEYNAPEEFKSDVNQIFTDAKIFHSDPNNSIHKAANALQEIFNVEAARLPHILTQDEINSVSQRYIELRILKYKLNKTTHI